MKRISPILACAAALPLATACSSAQEPEESFVYETEGQVTASDPAPPPLDCSGEEPFFALEVDPATAIFSTPEGGDRRFALEEAKRVETGLERYRELGWKLSGEDEDGARLSARVRQTGACVPASGREVPYNLLLTVDGETYEGCCATQ